jgi:hypothetical protein
MVVSKTGHLVPWCRMRRSRVWKRPRGAGVSIRVAKADLQDQPCIASVRRRRAAEGFPPNR